jgi:hypothetical protein
VIRRVIRGIYDYPRSSELLGRQLGPNLDQVAQALARKFGWRIQPSGAAAQNILGISTQVPSKLVYLSDGPDRRYTIGKTAIEFKHTAPKETGFKLRQSSLIVHALKSLGQDRITPEVLAKIRKWLAPNLQSRVLSDTQTATGWIYAAIREICREGQEGRRRRYADWPTVQRRRIGNNHARHWQSQPELTVSLAILLKVLPRIIQPDLMFLEEPVKLIPCFES